MTIEEWNRVEVLFTEKFGWELGLLKMVTIKNLTNIKWLEDATLNQANYLRGALRRELENPTLKNRPPKRQNTKTNDMFVTSENNSVEATGRANKSINTKQCHKCGLNTEFKPPVFESIGGPAIIQASGPELHCPKCGGLDIADFYKNKTKAEVFI